MANDNYVADEDEGVEAEPHWAWEQQLFEPVSFVDILDELEGEQAGTDEDVYDGGDDPDGPMLVWVSQQLPRYLLVTLIALILQRRRQKSIRKRAVAMTLRDSMMKMMSSAESMVIDIIYNYTLCQHHYPRL